MQEALDFDVELLLAADAVPSFVLSATPGDGSATAESDDATGPIGGPASEH